MKNKGKSHTWAKQIFSMLGGNIEAISKRSFLPEITPMTEDFKNQIGYACVKNLEKTKLIEHQDSVKFTGTCLRSTAI